MQSLRQSFSRLLGIGGHHSHLLPRIDPVDCGKQLRSILDRCAGYKTKIGQDKLPWAVLLVQVQSAVPKVCWYGFVSTSLQFFSEERPQTIIIVHDQNLHSSSLKNSLISSAIGPPKTSSGHFPFWLSTH